VCAAALVAALAATSQAEDASPAGGPRRTIEKSPDAMAAFLKEAGYVPRELAKTGWVIESKRPHVNKAHPELREGLYVRAGVGESGDYVVLSSPAIRYAPDVEIPRDVLLEMLRFNAGDGGVQFCIAKKPDGERFAYLLRFVDNRALVPGALEFDIEDLFAAIRATVKIWDKDSWPKGAGSTPGPADGAMEPGK
jgi:hypothetical protein